MIALVAATAPGRALAARLGARLDGASVQPGTAAEALAAAWPTAEAIVCCMAVGAAVRLTAPLLGSKHTDPPVVVVDDAGHHAVVLLGAHHGGNALAEQDDPALREKVIELAIADNQPELVRQTARVVCKRLGFLP